MSRTQYVPEGTNLIVRGQHMQIGHYLYSLGQYRVYHSTAYLEPADVVNSAYDECLGRKPSKFAVKAQARERKRRSSKFAARMRARQVRNVRGKRQRLVA